MSKKRQIIFWASILVLAACVGYIVYYYAGQSQNKKAYEDLKQEVVKEPTAEPETEPVADDPQPVEIPIDFAALQAQNPDIYAWITIPGTEVAYPVVQSATDNSYYLDYTIDGVYGYPGSIYTENYNSRDFTDFDTVIYGHDMNDGSMFGTLKSYRDETFLNEHRHIIIYTPDHIRTYQVFAAVTYDDRHILQTFDFTQSEQRQSYLNSINSCQSGDDHVMNDAAVDVNSRIITLSTCISSQPNNRYLIEAVLVNEQ